MPRVNETGEENSGRTTGAADEPSCDDTALMGLDEGMRKIFEEMPIETAVSPDQLVSDGVDVSDVITALTFLELCGLVSSLPGGLYIRK